MNTLADKQPWQYRAVESTGGNKTLMGCFILAILGWQHGRHPPRFGRVAVINKDGMLFSNMQDKNGRMYRNHCLGSVQTVTDNFRGLAEHLKLNDEETKQMFSEFRKWITHDERANQSNEERGLKQ